jgi:FG-GAP-like repeat/FG-GAP repeat
MRIAVLSVIAAVLFAVPVQAQSSGRFAPSVVYTTDGWSPASVAIADVNGDGKPDLVVSNTCANTVACGNINITSCVGCDGTVAVLMGVGDGTFQPPVTYGSGGYGPATVVIADVNGDGKPDVIVANQCVPPTPPSVEPCNGNNLLPGSLGVLLGNGDGTFQTAVAYPSVGSFGGALAVADVNGDGKPDAVLGIQCNSTSACSGHSQVAILLGNGDGTFRSPVTYDAGGYADQSIAIQDVNGDGYPDIVTANQCSTWSCPDTGVAGVLLGNGDGTFRSAMSYHSSGTASSIAIADVNGDGKPDLVLGNFCQSGFCSNAGVTADVLLGNGDGTFRTAVTYASVGFGAAFVTATDVDGDGKVDLIVAASCDDAVCDNKGTVSFLTGNGDGTFRSPVNYSSGGSSVSFVAAADLNGDSAPEIVVLNSVASTTETTHGVVGVLINITHLNGPIVSLSAKQLTFTSTVIGSNSSPQTVTLSSVGTASLSISSIQIAGADAASFSQTNTCGSSLGAGADCNISVVYTPSANGTSNATLTTSDGAPGSPHKVSLTGTTTPLSQVTLDPSSLTFGSIQVGSSSPYQSVRVTNTGNSTLNITQIQISGDFQEGGCPSPSSPGIFCCGAVAPGGFCEIFVDFAPTATGARAGTLTISGNFSIPPRAVTLIGTGVPGPPPEVPVVRASPTTVTFPSQYVGTTGLPQTVTITNTGGATLTIAGVTASPGDFGFLSNCVSPVAQNTSCTIGVFFDPTAGGTRTGTLSITDNATGSPQIVTLTGSGQDFSMTSSSTPSATVTVGQTANYSIAIAPTSGFAQNVSLSCGGGPAMSTCSVSPSSVALSGSAAKTVTVSVATSSRGFVSPFGGQQKTPLILLTTILALTLLLTASSLLRPSRQLRRAPALALLLLACLTMTLTSCGGGSGSSGPGSSSAEAGTYTVTVTGNFSSGSANITHATKLTLVVK